MFQLMEWNVLLSAVRARNLRIIAVRNALLDITNQMQEMAHALSVLLVKYLLIIFHVMVAAQEKYQ